MKQVTATVISSSEIMPGIYLIWLDSPHLAFEAKPGQFVMVRCGEDTLLRRPLSIHQLADGTRLALLFTVIGKGTRWLSQRQAGDNLDLLTPLGNGFIIHPSSRNLLLLAGGIGIAPLSFLAQKAVSQGHPVKILLGASTASQLYPGHLLPPAVELITATEDGTAGKKGMLTDFMPDFMGWADQVFACGPISMYQTIAARNPKTKPIQVSLEMRMGCGLGICYSCTVKTTSGLKQVCKDGPVFNLDDILWDKLNLTTGGN